MKCLMRYEWVKLLRSHLPEGKGILGMWARLASRVAFRKGIASYCGYENEVVPGMWSGGIVGVKSILGLRSRKKAFETLDILSELGYISYTLNIKTKKLTYQITDWVIRCSGEECMNGTVYINRLSAWYSRRLVDIFWAEKQENCVAVSDYILRAYISLCWSCENCKNYNNIYDCGNSYGITAATENNNIRGPCTPVDLTQIAKEFFTYE